MKRGLVRDVEPSLMVKKDGMILVENSARSQKFVKFERFVFNNLHL